MALSEKCIGRLENWKFESARERLGESQPTDRESELVGALAAVFGNSGWLFGQIEIIVNAAVGTLIPEEGGEIHHRDGDPRNNDPGNLGLRERPT